MYGLFLNCLFYPISLWVWNFCFNTLLKKLLSYRTILDDTQGLLVVLCSGVNPTSSQETFAGDQIEVGHMQNNFLNLLLPFWSPVGIVFILFLCLFAFVRFSKSILTISDKSGHPFFLPDLRENFPVFIIKVFKMFRVLQFTNSYYQDFIHELFQYYAILPGAHFSPSLPQGPSPTFLLKFSTFYNELIIRCIFVIYDKPRLDACKANSLLCTISLIPY